MGIKYVRMPLRVWSYDQGVIPADENVHRFLAIMADPKNHPVLIHCYRGVHRTGTYGAIYRMERQGWSNEDAIEELKASATTISIARTTYAPIWSVMCRSAATPGDEAMGNLAPACYHGMNRWSTCGEGFSPCPSSNRSSTVPSLTSG